MQHPHRNGKRPARKAGADARKAEYEGLTQPEKIKRARRAPGRSARQLRRLGASA